jgi:hypothetical protein
MEIRREKAAMRRINVVGLSGAALVRLTTVMDLMACGVFLLVIVGSEGIV